MALAQITGILEDHIVDGALPFSGELLRAGRISRLLNGHWGEDKLLLEGVAIRQEAGRVWLTGKLPFPEGQKTPVGIELWESPGPALEATIRFMPAEGNMAALFNALSAPALARHLGRLPVRPAEAMLCSAEAVGAGGLQQGLNVACSYQLPEWLRQAGPLFEGLQELALAGRLEAAGEDTLFRLFSAPLFSMRLGQAEAVLSLNPFILFPAGAGGETEALPLVLSLAASLPAFGKELAFQSEPLAEGMDWLLFSTLLPEEGIRIAGFEALKSLFPDIGFTAIPEAFHPIAGLAVSRFSYMLSLQEGTLRSVNLGLRMEKSWALIPDAVNFSGAGFDLLVEDIHENPYLSLILKGQARFGSLGLDAELQLPSTVFRLSSNFDEPAPLAPLLGSLMPGLELPGGLSLARIAGELDPEEEAYILECEIAAGYRLAGKPAIEARATLYLAATRQSTQAWLAAEFQAGGYELALSASLAPPISWEGRVDGLSLNALLADLLQLNIGGLPQIRIGEGLLRFSEGKLGLSGSLDFDFSSLAQSLGIPLPEAVNSFSLEHFAVSGGTDRAGLELSLGYGGALPLLRSSEQKIVIAGASLRLNGAGEIQAELILNGETEIADQVKLSFNQLGIGYDSGTKEWASGSKAALSLYGRRYELEVDMGSDHFRLLYPQELLLSDMNGSGKIALAGLSVFVEKAEGGQSWGIAGEALLQQRDASGKMLLNIRGGLSLEAGAGRKKLKISADAPALLKLDLPLGGEFPQVPELRLSLDDFGFEYAAGGQEGGGWLLYSKATMQIGEIPALLSAYLPAEPLRGYFRADGHSLRLAFDLPSTLQPRFPKLSLKLADGAELDLGRPELEIETIELELGPSVLLKEKIRIGLPESLNYLFGRKENGQPEKMVFNRQFSLELRLAKKLSLKAVSSPFADLEFIQKADDPEAYWTRWELGEVGTFEFRVPEFEYSKARWMASGGFNRVGQVRIPLSPLKSLLQKMGVPAVFLVPIPDAIPLIDIDFESDRFAEQLGQLFGPLADKAGPDARPAIEEVLSAIRTAVRSLPYYFQEYFRIEIPKSLIFEASVEAVGGAFSGGLRVLREGANARPIRLLLPGFPEITGLTLWGLGFGQKGSGAVITIEFDGYIDRFNLLELAIAVLTGAKQLANRLLLENTRFVLPSGFPLPIPLFYDRIALDYKNILGFEFETAWGNPDPDWGLSNYLGLIFSLIAFTTDKAYLFSENEFEKTLNTRLVIGTQRLKLPVFLGGRELKLPIQDISLDTGKLIGGLFDFFKTGNPRYAIQTIPLKAGAGHWIRVGAIDLDFGPLLEIKANWCITTQNEFTEEVLPAIQAEPSLASALDNDILSSLPQDNRASFDQGFIIILGGSVDIAGILGFKAQFAMALTARGPGQGGEAAAGAFETGFLLSGAIARTLKLEVKGLVSVEKQAGQPDRVKLHGGIRLLWKEQNLIQFSGTILVTNELFFAEVVLCLTDAFAIRGGLEIGKNRIAIQGAVHWKHSSGQPNQYQAMASMVALK